MEQKNEREARKDCIFFCEADGVRKKDRCEALREVYCRVENCKFYKTNKEEIRR